MTAPRHASPEATPARVQAYYLTPETRGYEYAVVDAQRVDGETWEPYPVASGVALLTPTETGPCPEHDREPWTPRTVFAVETTESGGGNRPYTLHLCAACTLGNGWLLPMTDVDLIPYE